jgi:small subunit ribosomal protein S16
MLKIRLQRVGRKHEPIFRLVLTNSKNATKSGKYLEMLGSYDARLKDGVTLKSDRISHWIKNGAQPSDTVHNMLIDKKLITGKKINKLPKKTAPKKEEVKEEAPEVKVESNTQESAS